MRSPSVGSASRSPSSSRSRARYFAAGNGAAGAAKALGWGEMRPTGRDGRPDRQGTSRGQPTFGARRDNEDALGEMLRKIASRGTSGDRLRRG